MFRLIILALLLNITSVQAAEPAVGEPRVGLGQAAPNDPPMLGNLKLSDPLVQQKYQNEPNLMRFLRATYSEACARGMLIEAARNVKSDKKNSADAINAAAKLLDSQRLWKLTSFEMEVIFGKSYLVTANYCDCIMKEVAPADLTNPRKGIDVVEKLPKSTQQTCERIASEKTEEQLKKQQELSSKSSK